MRSVHIIFSKLGLKMHQITSQCIFISNNFRGEHAPPPPQEARGLRLLETSPPSDKSWIEPWLWLIIWTQKYQLSLYKLWKTRIIKYFTLIIYIFQASKVLECACRCGLWKSQLYFPLSWINTRSTSVKFGLWSKITTFWFDMTKTELKTWIRVCLIFC